MRTFLLSTALLRVATWTESIPQVVQAGSCVLTIPNKGEWVFGQSPLIPKIFFSGPAFLFSNSFAV